MKTILTLFLAVSSTWASPAGIMTWLGDPTIDAFSLTGSYGQALLPPLILGLDSEGISSSVNVGSPTVLGTSINAAYMIERRFRVNSAGGFFLNVFGTGITTGLICNPGNCGGMGFDLSASSRGLAILDDESLAVPSINDPAYFDFIYSHMNDSITATASNSDLFFLKKGMYTLDQVVNATAWSAEYPGMALNVTSDLVGMDPPDAVPEPRYVALLVLLMAGVVAGLIRRSDRKAQQ